MAPERSYHGFGLAVLEGRLLSRVNLNSRDIGYQAIHVMGGSGGVASFYKFVYDRRSQINGSG